MPVLLQGAGPSAVRVEGEKIGAIQSGLVLLVGVRETDGEQQAAYLAKKIANLRIFEDSADKMNLSLLDVGGSALVISQFTLYANTQKGRRPSFVDAAVAQQAEPLAEYFAQQLEAKGILVERGRFGAHMQVEIFNDGPVTIMLERD